jgi:hypothetical protein
MLNFTSAGGDGEEPPPPFPAQRVANEEPATQDSSRRGRQSRNFLLFLYPHLFSLIFIPNLPSYLCLCVSSRMLSGLQQIYGVFHQSTYMLSKKLHRLAAIAQKDDNYVATEPQVFDAAISKCDTIITE